MSQRPPFLTSVAPKLSAREQPAMPSSVRAPYLVQARSRPPPARQEQPLPHLPRLYRAPLLTRFNKHEHLGPHDARNPA